MIIARAPLRITLGGGGTDVLSYSKYHGGFCLAAAINQYVYVTLHRTFDRTLLLKYSSLERVSSVDEVKHPIIREAIRFHGLDVDPHLEITSMADIPSGTGLGSSSSFTCALLLALYAWKRQTISQMSLADTACALEIGKLKEPIGKQDQHISACGGLKAMTFRVDGVASVKDAGVASNVVDSLEEKLLLFFTGYSRSAREILEVQQEETLKGRTAMLDNLHATKDVGIRSWIALQQGRLNDFADLMNDQYKLKLARSRDPYSGSIDEIYRSGLKNGALGGKLIGASGGGFLMFFAEDRDKLRAAMRARGLLEVPFHFDWSGTVLLTH